MKTPERLVFLKTRRRAGSDQMYIKLRANIRVEEIPDFLKVLKPAAPNVRIRLRGRIRNSRIAKTPEK